MSFGARKYLLHNNTQRGRSRVQHVQDSEADIERAKNLGLVTLVHSRCSKGEPRRAEPTSGLCFRAKVPKETNGEARRAEPMLWLW